MAHPEFFPQLQGFQSFALSSHGYIACEIVYTHASIEG
jgi:hypothetical protein